MIPRSALTVVAVMARHIFSVHAADGEQLAHKQVYHYMRPVVFWRETRLLATTPMHSDVVGFLGFVGDRVGGTVEGLLLAHLPGQALDSHTSAEPGTGQRWKEQISSATTHLHSQEPAHVWGDAQPVNVIIAPAGNATLVDFDGGYTAGWVDPDKAETV